MEFLHRYDGKSRQHFLFRQNYSFKVKPQLVYAGFLERTPGWHEEAHSHHFCEILFVSQGKGTVTVGDVPRRVQAGDILVYNADVQHAEESDWEDPMVLQFMALDRLQITNLPKNHLLPPEYDMIYAVGDYYDIVENYFQRMIGELQTKGEFYTEIAQNMSRNLVMYLFRIINEQKKEHILPLQSNKNIQTALNYIKDNYYRELSLDEVAAHCYLNKYYLAHLFTRQVGVSVGRYILQLRLQEAKRLLRETELPVSEISDRCGFADMSYFCRAFKKEFALTPLQYRKRER